MTETEIEKILRTGYDHHQAQRFDEAERLYRQVLADQPNHPDGLQFMGLLAGATQRYPLAIDMMTRVIAFHPKVARLHATLGDYLAAAGHHAHAAESYHRALDLKPNDPTILLNLGAALKNAGAHQESIDILQKALDLQPDSLIALVNLGAVYTECGRFDDAVAALRKAVTLHPHSFEAHVNLGSTLKNLHRIDESIAVLKRAIELNDQSPEAFNNFGVAMLLRGDLDQAAASFRRAIDLHPAGAAPAYHNLAITLKDQGLVEEAIAAHDRAIALDPKNALFHTNRLLVLHLDTRLSPAEIFREHKKFERFAPEVPRVAHLNERLPERQLKIAYVSPDFRKHSVSFFLLPALENHNRKDFHVTCYASSPVKDEITERISKSVDRFTSIVALSHERAAELMRDDEIDILIDLAGHTANSRLLTFARKPAPIQFTWLGYPGTTGLAAIDYRLSDPFADPPGLTDEYSSEQILRLPSTAWCFHPLSGSPPVNPLPAALKNNYITFGTFNAFGKVSRTVLELWAQILHRVPNSRLLLKNNAMRSQLAINNLRQFFASRDIAAERLEILPWQEEFTDHLQAYHRLDIGLDTFPYHGTTTTCEALWMGVPSVTLAGQTHASRVGVSLLTNAGLPHLVATTPDQYVTIAAETARDLPRLAHLRTNLREQMQSSPLMNARQFTTSLENVYRRTWQHWCGNVRALAGRA